MAARDSARVVSRWGIAAGAGVVLVLDASLLWTVMGNVNTWWFFITVIVAYLVAEGFTLVYDKIASGDRSEIWIPMEFAIFTLVIFAGATAAEYATAFIAHAFDSPSLLAYVAFFVLNLIPCWFLYWDFLHRGKFRIVRQTKRA